MGFSAVLERKFIRPFVNFLKQGITPGKLAVTVALGAVLGLLPFPGVTTFICFLLALVFRLNLAAIEIVNYSVYPLQILMFIPFIRAGERLIPVRHIPVSFPYVYQMFEKDWLTAVKSLWQAVLAGCLAWLILSIPLFILVYFIAKVIFRRLPRERSA